MNNIKFKNKLQNIAIILIIAIFFMADRFLKQLALTKTASQELISKFFLFNFTENYNISFSLPIGGPLLNVVIAAIIIALIITIFRLILKNKGFNGISALLTFILFGAISNLVDRLLYGFVIDYLELKYFTVFNIADAMISVSVAILIFKLLKSNKYAQ